MHVQVHMGVHSRKQWLILLFVFAKVSLGSQWSLIKINSRYPPGPHHSYFPFQQSLM